MKINREWLQKATDSDLTTMLDNIDAQIEELSIGVLDDLQAPIPTKLEHLELESDVIKGEISQRTLERPKGKAMTVVESKPTAVILPFKPRTPAQTQTSTPPPQQQA